MQKNSFINAAAIAAAVVATLTAQSRAQERTTQPSPLVFALTEWDFGTIREEGGAVSHTFEFTNTATTPVAIDRASASCGCTVPEYPRSPIAAGQKGTIKVTFDPRGYPGDFSKSVAVVSGGGKWSNMLTIKGRVTPRVKSIEEQYPHELGGGVRLDGVFVAFRNIGQGHMTTTAVKWVNTSKKSVTLAVEPVTASGVLEISAPEKLCAGCRGEISLTYDLREREAYGAVHDVLRFTLDGSPSPTTLYTAMMGVDDFDGVDMDTAPRFFLDAQYHNFGSVRPRAIPYSFRLTASNEGSTELHIRSVATGGGGVKTTLRAGMTLAPGTSLPFEVMFYSRKYRPGEVAETITVVVDDPMRPVREIRLAAQVND